MKFLDLVTPDFVGVARVYSTSAVARATAVVILVYLILGYRACGRTAAKVA